MYPTQEIVRRLSALEQAVNDTLAIASGGGARGTFVVFAPVNGVQALTQAQSDATVLDLSAGATAAVTLQSVLTPTQAKGRLVFVRNSTGQAVTYEFATGTGVVIADGAAAVVSSDGVNAYLAITGT
jgi:hypothetical protein